MKIKFWEYFKICCCCCGNDDTSDGYQQIPTPTIYRISNARIKLSS